MTDHLNSLIREIASGLTYEERFGGWAAATFTNYNARVVAESVLEACVRHPEWAMGAVTEMRECRDKWETPAIEERVQYLINGAFVERHGEEQR